MQSKFLARDVFLPIQQKETEKKPGSSALRYKRIQKIQACDLEEKFELLYKMSVFTREPNQPKATGSLVHA